MKRLLPFILLMFTLALPGLPPARAAGTVLIHVAFIKNYNGCDSTLYVYNPNTLTASVIITSGASPGINRSIPAHGSLLVASSDFAIPNQLSPLLISSDLPVESANRVVCANRSGDQVAYERSASNGAGLRRPAAPFSLRSVPLLPGESISFTNLGFAVSTYNENIHLTSGFLTTEITGGILDPGGLANYLNNLTESVINWLYSTEPFAGVIIQNNPFEIQPAVITGLANPYLPRVFTGVDEGAGARLSPLWIHADTALYTQVNFYESDGTLAYAHPVSIPENGAVLVEPHANGLPPGQIFAAAMASSAASITEHPAFSEGATAGSSGGYRTETALGVHLPALANNCTDYSLVSIFNPGGSPVSGTVDFYNNDGSAAKTTALSLPAYGWVRTTRSDLPANFSGSATVSANDDVTAQVDVYSASGCKTFMPLAARQYYSNFFPGLWEHEPNNTYLQASGLLYSDYTYYGNHNDSKDYYAVRLESSGSLAVSVDTPLQSGVQLQLFYEGVGSPPVAADVVYPYSLTYSGSPGMYYIYLYTDPARVNNSIYSLRAVYP